jgi:hypothetical protein
LGLLGVVAAHLLSRQRPRALALATARFLPSGMLEATTLQKVPIDRWWMLLRLCIVALLALGVAQPVITGTKVPERTVLLLDRTLPEDAQRAALSALTPTDVVIPFDTMGVLLASPAVTPAVSSSASLSAALSRVLRARDSLAQRSTTMHVSVASRFAPGSIDPSTPIVRALIPDSIEVLPVTVAPIAPRERSPIVVRAIGDDPIAATAQLLGGAVATRGAVVQRGGALTSEDSLAAQNGATVVWWPASVTSRTPILQAITVGSRTWIAALERDSSRAAGMIGQAIGWWADGSPAVRMQPLGRGCVLSLGVSLPASGDQTLSLAAQAWLAALITSCDRDESGVAAAPAWLSAPPRSVSNTAAEASLTSAAAPWLVAAALCLALTELLLRRRRTA